MALEDLSEADRQKAMALYQFVQGNPDVAKQVRKLAREKNPNMPVPETDVIEDRFASEIDSLRAELKKRDEQATEHLQTQRRAEAHSKIRSHGLDPDDVEKTMIANKIGDYDVAIKFIKQERELAPATPESVTPMSMPNSKDLWADRNRWAKSQAFEAINELRANRMGAR
jgi:hypothetical protein